MDLVGIDGLAVRLLVGVAVGEAEMVVDLVEERDPVGVCVCFGLLRELVGLIVWLAVPESEPVPLGVGGAEAEAAEEGEPEGVDIATSLGVGAALAGAEAEAEAEGLRLGVGAAEPLALLLSVPDADFVSVTVPVGEGNALRDDRTDEERVGLGLGLPETDCVEVPDTEPLGDLVGRGETVPERVELTEAVPERVPEGEADAEMVRMSEGSVVVRGLAETVADVLLLDCGEALEVGVFESDLRREGERRSGE